MIRNASIPVPFFALPRLILASQVIVTIASAPWGALALVELGGCLLPWLVMLTGIVTWLVLRSVVRAV
jgi:hypothetical protein